MSDEKDAARATRSGLPADLELARLVLLSGLYHESADARAAVDAVISRFTFKNSDWSRTALGMAVGGLWEYLGQSRERWTILYGPVVAAELIEVMQQAIDEARMVLAAASRKLIPEREKAASASDPEAAP